MLYKKKIIRLFLLFTILWTMSSCVPGPNDFIYSVNTNGYLAGFFRGLWHGFTLLFTFIISLFNKDINIYEVHNSGALYNLGYLIGVGIFFSGSGSAGKKAKRK